MLGLALFIVLVVIDEIIRRIKAELRYRRLDREIKRWNALQRPETS